MSDPDQLDNLKALKSCDENIDIFKWHFPLAKYDVSN
jgi:hypothetical protein